MLMIETKKFASVVMKIGPPFISGRETKSRVIKY